MPGLTQIRLLAMMDPTRAREAIITSAYQDRGNMKKMASRLGASIGSMYRICSDLELLPEIKKIRRQVKENDRG